MSKTILVTVRFTRTSLTKVKLISIINSSSEGACLQEAVDDYVAKHSKTHQFQSELAELLGKKLKGSAEGPTSSVVRSRSKTTTNVHKFKRKTD